MNRTLILVLSICLCVMMSACVGWNTNAVEACSSPIVDSLWLRASSSEKITQTLVIDIEKLNPPKDTLAEYSYSMVLNNILGDLEVDDQQIIAKNKDLNQLVTFSHPFFEGMHRAYADHRPFVLTPDAIWLLICQGFSYHVNNNAEELRHLFVDFEGKKKLTVLCNDIYLNNPDSPWEKYFPEFTSQIASYVGDSLVTFLSADFSSSTLTTRTASQITVMTSMKEYFDYELVFCICGIPKVILEGTPADWQRIIDGVQFLRRYKMDWWVDEMLPVLEKIKRASEGEVDKKFWRNMYKQHDEQLESGCGGTETYTITDGWMVKFYPYYDDKARTNLKRLVYPYNLPPEIVSVPLSFRDESHGLAGGDAELTLYSGFVGLSQNAETFALKPEIGWFITK